MAKSFGINEFFSGINDAVVQPIVSDVRAGNRSLKENFPLAYNAVQLYPPVGVPTAYMNYADAMGKGDSNAAVQEAISSIPVVGTYKVGSQLATGARQALGAVAGSSKRAQVTNAARKVAAGEDVAQMFDAGNAEGAQIHQTLISPQQRPVTPTNVSYGLKRERG